MHSCNKASFVVVSFAAVLLAATIGCNNQNASQATLASTRTDSAAYVRPNSPPPKFRVFHQPEDDYAIVPVVVPSITTNQDVESLLWLIKDHVDAGSLGSLGIKSTRGFQKAGMIEIFRSPKCASETYAPTLPCGKGNHSVAFYQWGIKDDPHKDFAAFTTEDDKWTKVFGSADSH